MDTPSTAAPEAPAFVADKTVEDALLTAGRAFDSMRMAGNVRRALAKDAEVELRCIIRRHHDGQGFCVALDLIERQPAAKVFWRTKLT